MASEVRVNSITNRSGLGTATFNNDGSITVAGNLNLNSVTTTARNAGVGTATGALVYDTEVGVLVYNGSEWQTVKSNFTASGGTVDTTSRSGYKVHTFTTPGTFSVTSGSATVEYLMVGGGGAGGGSTSGRGGGGGGGAGSLKYGTTTLGVGDYPVVRGAGGAGAPAPTAGSSGSNTTAFGLVAGGGGAGGVGSEAGPEPLRAGQNGTDGGSGGGGGYRSYSTVANGGSSPGDSGGSANIPSPTNGWGNDGAGVSSPSASGAGGGGAGTAGSTNTGSGGGTGGIGGSGLAYSISGTLESYAAGAAGGDTSYANGSPATGNGGTGRYADSNSNTGDNGGSGVVIIAYPTA